MASKYTGQALMDIGKSLPGTFRSNKELERQKELDEIRKKLLREQLLSEELSRTLSERKSAREQAGTRSLAEALQLMREPQQEPVLPEYQKPEFEPSMPGTPEPMPSVAGDRVSQLQQKYLPEQEMVPYKSPLGREEAFSQSGAMEFLDQPSVNRAFEALNPEQEGKSEKKTLLGWDVRREDWIEVESMPEGPEKDKAKQSYLMKWSPSVGYASSPEAIEQAARKTGATTSTRIKTEYGTKAGIPGSFKQSQYAAGNYAHRIEQTKDVLEELMQKGFDPGSLYNMIKSPDAFNAIKDTDQRRYAQAMRNFINATLRRESGAAIAESEFKNANKQYFAQLIDDKETLAQKEENRARVLDAFKAEAGGAYDQIVSESKKRESETTTDKYGFKKGEKKFSKKYGRELEYMGNNQWR